MEVSKQTDEAVDNQFKLAEKSKRRNQQKPTPRPSRDVEKETFRWQMMLMQIEMQSSQGPVMRTTFVSGDSHSCRTPLDKLKPIHLCDMEVPKVHKGRYLVCQAIVSPFALVATTILVQDLNGDVEEVAFYNFRYDFTDASWLSPGTIMVVKEPYLRYGSLAQVASMRIDSPSDVIFVDPNDFDFLQRIGAQKWFVPMTNNVEDIRKLGNDYFMKKDYDTALHVYNRAIRYNPNLAVLHLNKASTCLRSGHFQIAYDAAKLGMEKGGDREKALHRLGLAAYGLREWKISVENFEMLQNEFPNNKEVEKELKRAKERLKESQTGQFNFKEMYINSQKGQKEFDVADYTIPSIEVIEIPGKGRGIIANKDIPRGNLLLVSKAFACGHQKDVSTQLIAINLIKKQADNVASKLQITRAIENLQKNPKKAKEFYALYSGDSTKEDIPEGVIDTALVEKISVHNRFGSETFKENSIDADDNVMLFLLPSYFNHSCVANAYRIFYGDIMIVYSTTSIKKGDEITISYKGILDSYSKRKADLLKGWGFVCKCELCEIEKLDGNCSKRVRIFNQFEEFSRINMINPKQVIVKGKSVLKQIRESYTNRTEFKFELMNTLFIMAKMHAELDEIEENIEYLKEAIELVDERLNHDLDVPMILINIAKFYLTLNQTKKGKEFVRKAAKLSYCVDEEYFKEVYGLNTFL